eukprot:gene9534-12734_t
MRSVWILLAVALFATAATVDARKSPLPLGGNAPPAFSQQSSPTPSHWAPAPPTPQRAGAAVGRNKFMAYMAMTTGFNFSDVNATLLEADLVIAASRAFKIPENNGPTDTPPGVAVWEVRAIDAADLVNNSQLDASFIGGIYVEFDTSYPMILTLPGSINTFITWPRPIFISNIRGEVSVATVNHSFSTSNTFFYFKYHIAKVVGSPILTAGDPNTPTIAFGSNSGASLVPVEGEMDQLLSSMTCEPSSSKCWVAGQEETGCSSVHSSDFGLTNCDEKLPFVCNRS